MDHRDSTSKNKTIKRIAITAFIILAVVNIVAVLWASVYYEWLKVEPHVKPYLVSNAEIVNLDEPVNKPDYGIVRKTINRIKGTGNSSESKDKNLSDSNEEADFEITMLDVGQGLSLLVRADDKYMLYDGGESSSSSYVVSYLKKRGIDNLSVIFVSHYDEDHIAGIIGVLNTIPVSNVVCPYYEGDTAIYNSFKEKLIASRANVVNPTGGDRFSLGNCVMDVLNPQSHTEYDDNNSSIVIRITCGSFRCLITGDAEEKAEKEIINRGYEVGAELLVAGHHGSSDSSSPEFIRFVGPEYAFISCGKDNPYGHPAQKTLDTLKNNNVKIFRSDLQGEVTCYVNWFEGRYWFSESPCQDYGQESIATKDKDITENEATVNKETAQQPTQQAGGSRYVLNTRSRKFHYPFCDSVGQMAEHNKKVVTASRDELIRQGYSPCGNCRP